MITETEFSNFKFKLTFQKDSIDNINEYDDGIQQLLLVSTIKKNWRFIF